MMKLTLLVVVILYQVVHDLACTTRVWNPSRHEAIAAWDYYVKYSKGKDFKPNPQYYITSDKREYGRGIIRHIYKKQLKPPQIERPQEIRHPESFGLGHGKQDEKIPPGIISRRKYGHPFYCLDLVAYGDCRANLTCWGYDSATDDCRPFTWSGCGGNLNRWWRKSDCERACGSTLHLLSDCCYKYVTMEEVGKDWSKEHG